jgi:hypothetical protein
MRTTLLLPFLLAPAVSLSQPMPAESRDNIHTLLDNHEKITRTVTLTDDGYVAVTESDDPELAKVLRAHIAQMEARLKEGLMVRRWDPAFVEVVAHFDQMETRMEPTGKGLKMTVKGKTPEAVKVAQNHAAIVTEFAHEGWTAHDRTHRTVLDSSSVSSRGGCACGNCGGHGRGGRHRGGR